MQGAQTLFLHFTTLVEGHYLLSTYLGLFQEHVIWFWLWWMWGGGLQCITLVRWLEERYETVYRRHPGFQEGATPLSLQEQALPLDLPDTLRGEQWTFVQLPLSGLFSKPLMRDESFVLKPASACLSSDHVLDQYMFRGQDWCCDNGSIGGTGVLEELEAVERGAMFGSVLDLDTLGIDLSSDIMIPGVAVASSRATPLAGLTLLFNSQIVMQSCGGIIQH